MARSLKITVALALSSAAEGQWYKYIPSFEVSAKTSGDDHSTSFSGSWARGRDGQMHAKVGMDSSKDVELADSVVHSEKHIHCKGLDCDMHLSSKQTPTFNDAWMHPRLEALLQSMGFHRESAMVDQPMFLEPARSMPTVAVVTEVTEDVAPPPMPMPMPMPMLRGGFAFGRPDEIVVERGFAEPGPFMREVEVPDVMFPEMKMPDMMFPEMKISEMKISEVEFPEMEIVKFPEMEISVEGPPEMEITDFSPPPVLRGFALGNPLDRLAQVRQQLQKQEQELQKQEQKKQAIADDISRQAAQEVMDDMRWRELTGLTRNVFCIGCWVAFCINQKRLSSARQVQGPLADEDHAPKGQAAAMTTKQPEVVASQVAKGYLQGLYVKAQADAEHLAAARYLANVYERAMA